jgi:hypothetical protein
LTVKIAVESQRLIDNRPNSFSSKFFHNKITTGIFENSKNYISIFNPVLIISIVGPLGVFLLFNIFLNIKKITNVLFYIHLAYVFISSVLLVLTSPKIGFYNFAFSLYTFTFWSIKFVSKKTLLIIIFLMLLVISFWYYSLDWQMKPICNEIFFN